MTPARQTARAKARLMRVIFLALIRFYQKFISPVMGSSCRYYPSCSNYTYQAIERYGALRGS